MGEGCLRQGQVENAPWGSLFHPVPVTVHPPATHTRPASRGYRGQLLPEGPGVMTGGGTLRLSQRQEEASTWAPPGEARAAARSGRLLHIPLRLLTSQSLWKGGPPALNLLIGLRSKLAPHLTEPTSIH